MLAEANTVAQERISSFHVPSFPRTEKSFWDFPRCQGVLLGGRAGPFPSPSCCSGFSSVVKAPGLVPALKEMTQIRILVFLSKAAVMGSSGFGELPCFRVRLKTTESPKSRPLACVGGTYTHSYDNTGGLVVT